MKYLVKLFPAYTREKEPKIVVSPSFSRRPIFHDFENNSSFIKEAVSEAVLKETEAMPTTAALLFSSWVGNGRSPVSFETLLAHLCQLLTKEEMDFGINSTLSLYYI
jgi:hypothetical protein